MGVSMHIAHGAHTLVALPLRLVQPAHTPSEADSTGSDHRGPRTTTYTWHSNSPCRYPQHTITVPSPSCTTRPSVVLVGRNRLLGARHSTSNCGDAHTHACQRHACYITDKFVSKGGECREHLSGGRVLILRNGTQLVEQ